MVKSIVGSAWSLALLVLLPAGLAAQGYIYTNNDTAPNSISAYVFDAGVLNQIPHNQNDPTSTFPTGGDGSNGGFYASNRIIVVKGSTNDFLYASNSGIVNAGEITTVSAFTIDKGSGYLTPVNNGIPYSTGAFNDSGNSGVSLAATPDGQFLYVGSTGADLQNNVGSIAIFSIDPTTGALTPTSKSPVAAGGRMSSMKVSPDGKYLVAALPTFQSGSNFGAIAVFAIHGPGTPHEVHNSPYVLSSGPADSLEFNCAGNLLFAGGDDGYIYVFNFVSGKLTPVTVPPFSTGVGSSNRVVALSTLDNTLFASDPFTGVVSAFSVGTNGDLAFAGSDNASGTNTVNAVPGGLAVSNLGTFLFSADQNSGTVGYAGFSIFDLASSPPIMFQSLTTTVQATGFHSLAAYPGKLCSGTGAPAVVSGN
jgi:WD40 repeat protein